MNSFRLKSYFTFLGRNKLFTSINLFGFAVSLAVVILLGLYIQNQTSYDKFHKDRDRVWKLSRDGGSAFSAPIAADVKNRYPDEVEAITRVGYYSTIRLQKDQEQIRASTLAVDSTFFNIFSFPLLEGDPASQLRTREEVTITRSFATKMFGEGPALGKTLKVYAMEDTIACVVTGVATDFKNSCIPNRDILVRFDKYTNRGYLESYGSCNWEIFLKTAPGTDLQSKMPDLAEHFKTYFWIFEDGISKEAFLEPITDCYFDGNTMTGIHTSRTFLTLLGAAALAILLFAMINYVNLSVAQSGFRAKEAATRRLLGSSPGGLFAGFITETIIFCVIAAALGVVLASVAEPGFNKMMGTQMSVGEVLSWGYLLAGLAGAVVLGVVSGIVPSLVVSSHKPVEVVRGTFTRKTKMVYSRVLIVFQYCITIVLLGCAVTIMRQTKFMRTTDLGFNKENVVWMDCVLGNEKLAGLRDRLEQIPGVEAVSYCSGCPSDGGNNNTITYESGQTVSFQIFFGDSLYMDMLGIEVLRSTGIKDSKACYLNETAFKELNLPDSATMFEMYDSQVPLAGIIKDFHFRPLSQKIDPCIVGFYTGDYNTLFSGSGAWTTLVKIAAANPAQTYDQVKAACLDYGGGRPFDSGFIDAVINSWYDDQQRTYTIIGSFAVIAILIAALGMLAMATYYLRQRTAEIAIRKVFGSTDGEVLRKVIMNFMRMVVAAFVIAVPVIWYAMERWLAGYAYRIPLDWTIFALAGLAAFAVALVAVFWQSWKATTANPVDSLHR